MERGRADTGVERGNVDGFRRFSGSPNLVIGVGHLEPEIVDDVLVNQSEAPDSNHKQVCKWVEIGYEGTVPGCERPE